MKKYLRSKKKLQQVYNKGSLTYDKSRFGSEGGEYLDEVEKQIVFQLLKESSVLELGTGTSRYGVYLGKKGFRFTGIDITANMLKMAKIKVGNVGLDVNLVKMDAETISFRAEQFDNVICIHTFQYFLHPLKVLNGAYNVLKPGGRCIVSFESNSLLEGKLRKYFRHPLQTFYSINEVKVLFEKSGFKPIYEKKLFLFPLGLYRRLPSFAVKFVKIFDSKQNYGSLSIVAGVKPFQ